MRGGEVGVMPTRRPAARVAAIDALPDLPGFSRLLPSGRSLLVGFAIIAVALAGYISALETSVFAVQRIEVEGAPPRASVRVEAALANRLQGESLLAVDAADVDRALRGLPDVQALGFDRAYPRTLRVTVAAERPVAVLRRGADAWLISERGRVLRALPGTRPSRLPRIWVAHLSAPREGALLDVGEALRPALALGAVLAADGAFIGRVREARMREGEVDLVLRSGTELRLGSPDDLALKIAVAQAVLKATPRPGAGYIDVSVPERPVADVESQLSG
jgi:cell division protein FtsQ